ncbi:hypothetical protein PLICRDRAFT_131156, partial [Plicaturopsis crispa FD-325 SS-3]
MSGSPAPSLPPSQDSYCLLSSTKYDPFLKSLKWNNDTGPTPFFLLPYHFHRLALAAEVHGWRDVASGLTYDALKRECERAVAEYARDGGDAPLKVRITLSRKGALHATAQPTRAFTADPSAASFFQPDTDNPSLFRPVHTVRLDTRPTAPSLFTRTKTTWRVSYDEARARTGVPPLSGDPKSHAHPPPPLDVILYNTASQITECSTSNVAFYRHRRWITPPLSTGCLAGALRRWLLAQGRIKEGEIRKDEVREGEWVLLFNGVGGCRVARV